ncbi:MAG TPA: 3-methyl-2-oxobutanoate hydroxymethyltransferase [Elusimicrobiota bacterium]|jgi:3-methyl-2-oxobutanoate hydroxymethyltransferase|nr:3-methyl-2-oxobutanoate hydroxymethyltransferase [Elusimicrobiota bacterium]
MADSNLEAFPPGGIPLLHDRITLPVLSRMKAQGEAIAALSIYDACHARLFDRAGGEMIIVGDSAAMTIQGEPNTKCMSMDEMLIYTRSVRNGTKRLFVVGDMPLGSYEVSNQEAVRNAARFMRETDCNAVKIETNRAYLERIAAVANFCPVIMHAGLNPNKAEMLGGYRTYGKTAESVRELCEVVVEGERAGACMILLESVTEEVSQRVKKLVDIPVLGIAGGRGLDGQLLISYDLLDLYEWPGNRTPRHFKAYRAAGEGLTAGGFILNAYQWYVKAVKAGEFPEDAHAHHLPDVDLPKVEEYFRNLVRLRSELSAPPTLPANVN